MADRRAVAFLFTDVEGSTRLLRSLGEEAFGALLAEHGRLLAAAVANQGGEVVDMQGDACFAAFPHAHGAVEAAVEAQRALSAADWPAGSRPRVRMGVHLGHPVAASGRYLGLDVHLAARIGAVAHGGQVLVSRAVRNATARASGPSAFTLRSFGQVELKDFDEPQELWQVVAPGLRDDFPPLAETVPGHLPFAGRETELADAAAAAIARSARRQERRRILAGLAAVAGVAAAVLFYLSTRPPTVSVVGNSVAEVDIGSGRVIRDVRLGAPPTAIAAGPSAIYAVSGGPQGTVTRIDPDTGAPRTQSATGSTDVAVGFGSVWVANGLNRTITQLDPAGLTFVSKIPITRRLGVLGAADAHLAIGTDRVWVDNGGDAGVTALDPHKLSSRPAAAVTGLPTGAITDGGGSIWVGSGSYYFGGGVVVQVDPKTHGTMATFLVGEMDGFAYGFGACWVADSSTGKLEELRPVPPGTADATGRVVKQFPLGPGIAGVTVGADRVWVTNPRTGQIFGVEPTSGSISTFSVPGSPTKLVERAGRLWVAVLPTMAPVAPVGTRIAVEPGDIDTVDPATTNSALMYQLLYDAGLNLVRYADAPGSRGLRIVPDAASAMPRISRNGKVYTFTIRPGLRFSPSSSQPVTAATFKHTIERVFRMGQNTFQGILDFDFVGHTRFDGGAPGISGITAHGDRLTIRLTHADGDLLSRLALPPFTAVPTNWANPGAGGGVPSAGPYYIRAYAAGRVVLVGNPNYRGTRPRHLRAFTVMETPNPWRAVQTGRAAYAANGDAPTPRLRRALIAQLGPSSPAARTRRQQIYLHPFPGVFFIGMHTTTGPFANVLVRRAVNYAIDRPALAATLGPPAGVTDQYLSPATPGFPGSGLAYPLQTPDLRKARELMRQARVALPLRAMYYTSDAPAAARRARILKHDLRAIGIHIHTRTVPFATLQQAIDNPVPYPLIDGNFQFLVDDPALLLVDPPKDLETGPLTTRLTAAYGLTGGRRYRTYGRLDLKLAREYAPAAAYAYPQHIDFFAPGIGCQLYQPFFGIEIGKLCSEQ